MMIKKPVILLVTFITILFTAATAQAEDIKIYGFLSQSIIYSDNNPFYSDQTGEHFDFREIGISAAWNNDENIRIAGQLLSRKAGDLDNGDPKIDFLLLDYSYYNSSDTQAGFHVGRIKNQYGIYNSTRDVPHARPGVFVPQSVYFENYRDALLSIDGVNLYFKNHSKAGDFRLDFFTGNKLIENDTLEYQLYQQNIPGNFDEVDITGLKLSLDPGFDRNLSLAISLLDIRLVLENTVTFSGLDLFTAFSNLTADPGLFPDYITNLEVDALFKMLSIQYVWNEWVFTAEYMEIDSDINKFEVLHQQSPDINSTTVGYFFQAEWQFSEHLNLFSRYEELYYRDTDKDGTEFSQSTGGVAASQFAKALTLGARWFFTPDLSLTGEISINEGAGWLVGSSEIDYSSLEEDWNNLVVQLSYHF